MQPCPPLFHTLKVTAISPRLTTSATSRQGIGAIITGRTRNNRTMSSTSDAQEAKKALRKDIKTRLSVLGNDEVTTQSGTAQSLILALPQYQQAKTLSIYLSMPSHEAQTSMLVRDALGNGKQVFVPYIHYPPTAAEFTGGKKRKVMAMLRLSTVDEYEGLGRDGWGIPSLSKEGVEGRENATGGVGLTQSEKAPKDSRTGGGALDLIVVPGVAFDAQMNRLGHGAGFYDSFLTRFCEDGKRKKPFLVGLCLAEQIVGSEAHIPTSEWDWKVDAIAVGDGRLLTLI